MEPNRDLMMEDPRWDMHWLSQIYPYKGALKLTSSFTAEVIAIIKAMDCAMTEGWTSINICSDSLSVLTKLNLGLSSVFLFAKTDLSPIMMDLLMKISKIIHFCIDIKFT